MYQLRHGGASWDRLRRVRTLQEVKQRGQWSADASVRRYEAAAKVQAQELAVPQALQAEANRA
eukprot:4587497-Alexandrium_andersonii.AAC.1